MVGWVTLDPTCQTSYLFLPKRIVDLDLDPNNVSVFAPRDNLEWFSAKAQQNVGNFYPKKKTECRQQYRNNNRWAFISNTFIGTKHQLLAVSISVEEEQKQEPHYSISLFSNFST